MSDSSHASRAAPCFQSSPVSRNPPGKASFPFLGSIPRLIRTIPRFAPGRSTGTIARQTGSGFEYACNPQPMHLRGKSARASGQGVPHDEQCEYLSGFVAVVDDAIPAG